MTARQRVTSATVYVHPGGDDGWAGDDQNPFGTLYRAFECVHGEYDIAPPYSWTRFANYGYRAPLRIQLLENDAENPNLLPDPLFVDGLGCAGPIELYGDPTSHTTALNYCIKATNPLQGIAPQNGAMVICRGFRIWTDANCTALNPVFGGQLAYDTVTFGGGGKAGAIGSAGGSKVFQIGPARFVGGAGWNAVFAAIEQSQINFSEHAHSFDSAVDFGVMCSASGSHFTTQGVSPLWDGSELSNCTGTKFAAYRGSFIGFDHNLIPGGAGSQDSTSVVL